MTGALCLSIAANADTDTQTTHTTPHHAANKKKDPPPPLPSGTQGPVPQVPLDAIPAVAPQVTFDDGLLTIVAPNSTLGDILRSVKKQTSADIEVPPTANERVVTRLGPAPAREVMAELLNGSRFNYILLGSPEDANALTRVVLVAKTGPENPAPQGAPVAETAGAAVAPQPVPQAVPQADEQAQEQPDDTPDDSQEQNVAAEAEQQNQDGNQQGVKTPQQLLQEMQQRQMQIQQQQQQQGVQPGAFPAPGMPPMPHQPQAQPQDQ
jgi:hypothetical protein